MTYTRREWLRQALAATVTAGVVADAVPRRLFAAQDPKPAPPAIFADLRRNIGTFVGEGGTVGWLNTPSGLVIVDSLYEASAVTCLAGIKTRAPGRTIDLVLNTHHHLDHTGGNGVFRAGGARRIMAHARVPDLQKAAADRRTPPGPAPIFPDSTFETTFRTQVGDEVIAATHYGPAHTNGDVVVLFERANVAHMGDLVFNRRQPFVDRAAGASIAGWIAVLEKVTQAHGADVRYIYGHAGEKWPITGGRADLLVQRDFFSALLDMTRARIKAGVSREAFIKLTEPLAGFADHGPLNERVLAPAFDEVSAA